MSIRDLGILHVCLSFEELVRNPEPAIEQIYAHMKLPMSEAFSARVRQVVGEDRGHRSANHHSLEEYGLSERAVYAELADVFEFVRGCRLSAGGSITAQQRAVVADPAPVA